ncbi:hypothetical protein D3C78_1483970 [compost metagenome]
MRVGYGFASGPADLLEVLWDSLGGHDRAVDRHDHFRQSWYCCCPSIDRKHDRTGTNSGMSGFYQGWLTRLDVGHPRPFMNLDAIGQRNLPHTLNQ